MSQGRKYKVVSTAKAGDTIAGNCPLGTWNPRVTWRLAGYADKQNHHLGYNTLMFHTKRILE